MPQFTYPEFVFFCEAFQRLNHFEFEPNDMKIQQGEGRLLYIYEGMFRDNSNYKTLVELIYDGRDILWGIADGWEDADDELRTLYDALVIMKGGDGSACRVQALIAGSRFDGLTIEQALTSDERGAHLLGVPIQTTERLQGIYLLACHLSSCEMELIRFMIGLEGAGKRCDWIRYEPNETIVLPQAAQIRGNQLVGESMRWYLLYVTDANLYILLQQAIGYR